MGGGLVGPVAGAVWCGLGWGVDGIRYWVAVRPVVFGVPVLLGWRGILANYGRGVTEHEGLL